MAALRYLQDAMDNLMAVHQLVATAAAENGLGRLRLYRWQPAGIPEYPALWCWMPDSTSRILDTATKADDIIVLARLGIRMADQAENMEQLEQWADLYCEQSDVALLPGQVYPTDWADRTGMRSAQYTHDEVTALGWEFPITFHLHRRLVA